MAKLAVVSQFLFTRNEFIIWGIILSVNDEDTQALCLVIIDQKSKNIFINTIYRQPSGYIENFENYFGKFLKKDKNQDNMSS